MANLHEKHVTSTTTTNHTFGWWVILISKSCLLKEPKKTEDIKEDMAKFDAGEEQVAKKKKKWKKNEYNNKN